MTRYGVDTVGYIEETIEPDEAAKLAVKLAADAVKNKVEPVIPAGYKGKYGPAEYMIEYGGHEGIPCELRVDAEVIGKARTFTLRFAGNYSSEKMKSLNAARLERSFRVEEIRRKRNEVAAAAAIKLAPPGSPAWHAAKDKAKAVALSTEGARAVAARAAVYEGTEDAEYRDLPGHKRELDGDLRVFESLFSPRKYQLRHNGIIVKRDLPSLDAAKQAMFPYTREYTK